MIFRKPFFFFRTLLRIFIGYSQRTRIQRSYVETGFTDFAAKNIKKIEINSQRNLQHKKERSTWLLQHDKDFYAENTVIEKILKSYASQCTTINNSPEYGLVEPRISIKVAEYTVSIGNPSPTNEGEYIMVGDRYCRTRTIITNRFGSFNEYRANSYAHPISNIESIELNNGVLIEKTSGNWKQRAPFTRF